MPAANPLPASVRAENTIPQPADKGRSIWSGQPIQESPREIRERTEIAIRALRASGDEEAAGVLEARLLGGDEYAALVEQEQDQTSALRAVSESGDTEAAEVLRSDLGKLREKVQYAKTALESSGGDQFLSGMGGAFVRAGQRVADLVGGGDPTAYEETKDAQQGLSYTRPGNVGGFAGDVAISAPLGLGVGGLTRAALVPLVGRGAISSVVPLAVGGGAEGLALSEPGQGAQGFLTGAAMAGGPPALAYGLGRGARAGLSRYAGGAPQPMTAAPGPEVPFPPSIFTNAPPTVPTRDAAEAVEALTRAAGREAADPRVANLIKAGARLTRGQAVPKYADVEGASTSLIKAREQIIPAQQRGLNDTRRILLRAAAPEGTVIPVEGGGVSDVFAQLDEAFDSAYSVAKGHPVYPSILREGGKATSLRDEFAAIPVRRIGRDVADEKWARTTLGEILQKYGIDPSKKTAVKQMDSDTLLSLRSDLRRVAREQRQIRDGSGLQRADMIDDAEDAVSEALTSQLPPEVVEQIKRTDKPYALFKRFEEAQASAARSAEARDFTAHELNQAAIRQASKADRARGQRGAGDLRPLIEALAVIEKSSRVPQTGVRQAILSGAKDAAGLSARVTSSALDALQADRAIQAATSPRALVSAVGETPGQRAARRVLSATDISPEAQNRILQALMAASGLTLPNENR